MRKLMHLDPMVAVDPYYCSIVLYCIVPSSAFFIFYFLFFIFPRWNKSRGGNHAYPLSV